MTIRPGPAVEEQLRWEALLQPLLEKFCHWDVQKVHLNFSIRSYRKKQNEVFGQPKYNNFTACGPKRFTTICKKLTRRHYHWIKLMPTPNWAQKLHNWASLSSIFLK